MSRRTRGRAPEGLKHRPQAGRLLKNAFALMISSGGTSALGVAFWGAAAHLATARSLGRTSAEIAAMVLLANLAQLSFGSIFERFLPVAGRRTGWFVKRAYAMCISFALVISLVYIFSGFGHSFMPSSTAWRALFVAAVVMWTIFILQDSVLIGLRASKWVPVENIFFAVLKLALLPVLIAVSSTEGVFLAWSAPVVVTIIAVSWYVFKVRIPEHETLSSPEESLPSTRELVFLAGAQYATLLFSVFTPSIVTLLVIQRLGAVANAYYYVPAIVINGLGLFNWSIVRSFLVEAAHEPHALRRHSNTALAALAAVLTPCVVIGVIFAPAFLRIFGSSYEAHGTALLRMMLLSLPGSAVTIFYSTFAWLDKRVWWLAARELASVAIFFTVLLVLIGRYGINAIGIASLVSSGIQGIFFLPSSIKRYRLTSNSEPPTEPTRTTEEPA